MLYSEMVKKASLVCFDAHKEDVDKGGYPYVMHPFYLAFQMPDEDSVCVALLHDVIEDHSDKYSFEYLEKAGFNENVLAALRLLTHEEGVPYMEYVAKIKTNETATRVKIADLEHNLDSTRRGGDKSFYKDETYQKALAYLTDKE